MNYILASQSPRRKELLELMHIPFLVRVSHTDETMDPGLPAQEEVARVSLLKAQAVSREPEDVVIAADTIVVCEGKILGKPRDPEQAVQMLQLLSGKHHEVMTGLTVLQGDRHTTCTQVTRIHFRELSLQEIREYVAGGEPMDKAGAYGIQGGGALFADSMNGDYYNVMGLPVCRLHEILKKMVKSYQEDRV